MEKSKKIENAVVLIPCYNPDEEIMTTFIDKLSKVFSNIVFVNDGCSSIHGSYFSELSKKYPVLKHYRNFGKGRGIKNGLNYILNNYEDCKVIITADCDGQHSVEDIIKCYEASLKNQQSLILGSRDFNNHNVPFKSRYGNKLTRNIFKIFVGLTITDTQTGLRAMSKSVANLMLSINGERYEYETECLIACKSTDIPIIEVPIKTIYIEENRRSHFNPIKDSILIYKLFIKYIMASLSSFLVDIVLFSIFLTLFSNLSDTKSIVIATILARILSSTYNYFINAKLIFKKMNKASIIKYFILVFITMWTSASIVSYLKSIWLINSVVIKVLIDAIIFVINFVIQREFIFKKS